MFSGANTRDFQKKAKGKMRVVNKIKPLLLYHQPYIGFSIYC